MIKKVNIYCLLFCLIFSLSRCSSAPTELNEAASLEDVIQEEIANSDEDETEVQSDSSDEKQTAQASDEEDDEAGRIARKRKWLTNLTPYAKKKISMWVHYFAKKSPDRFVRFLTRGDAIKEVVEETLEQYDLPKEFFYLALIESGYQNHAHSHAGAVGTWQFIRSTGRHYGLQVDHYVDERRDPIRSTESAAKYLKELYRQFGSWHLAMAAYNSGEARVKRAIRKGRTNDYWELCRRKLLPPETRNYVPKFIAAILIGETPSRYGLRAQETPSYPSVEAVELPAPVKLSTIASTIGVSYDALKQVNPHIRRGVTPPGKTYEVWIPQDKVELAKSHFQSLERYRISGLKAIPYRSIASTHRVRRGESLGLIARKYRISVRTLKRINGLRSSQIYAGQRLRVNTKSYRGRVASQSSTHQVRRGESLGSIARKYRVSINTLKSLNGLRSSQIYAGQRLKVRGSAQISKADRKLARVKKPKMVTYRVRRGDNLYSIAKRFQMSVDTLKENNNLSHSKIFVGQHLKITSNQM